MTKIGKRLSLALLVCALTAVMYGVAGATASTQVPLSGTGSPVTGGFTPSGDVDATQVEFAGVEDEDSPDPYGGNIIDRSLSAGGVSAGIPTTTGKRAKSNPAFVSGFQGLNFYQQRYARGGNQFSVEPPDQGMCAGNGYVVEAVNDVLNVFDTSGQSVLPDNTATNIVGGFPRNVNHAVDLNSFLGYAPAINRSTGIRGPEVTDPSCIYDAATQRFFVLVQRLFPQLVDRSIEGQMSDRRIRAYLVSQGVWPTAPGAGMRRSRAF